MLETQSFINSVQFFFSYLQYLTQNQITYHFNIYCRISCNFQALKPLCHSNPFFHTFCKLASCLRNLLEQNSKINFREVLKKLKVSGSIFFLVWISVVYLPFRVVVVDVVVVVVVIVVAVGHLLQDFLQFSAITELIVLQ